MVLESTASSTNIQQSGGQTSVSGGWEVDNKHNRPCLWVILTAVLSVLSSSAHKGCFFLQIVLCMLGQVYYPDLQLQRACGSALKLAFSWNCKHISLMQPDCLFLHSKTKIIWILVPLQYTFCKSFQNPSIVAWERAVQHLNTKNHGLRLWFAVYCTEAGKGENRVDIIKHIWFCSEDA